jgi:hypothetical protein
VQQYSNQSMGVWYNPITNKPASILSTAEESAAEPAGGQRAGQGGPCARIGSRREPRAWACDVSVVPGLCGIDLLDEVDGIGKGLGRSLSSLGVVGLHADCQLLFCGEGRLAYILTLIPKTPCRRRTCRTA